MDITYTIHCIVCPTRFIVLRNNYVYKLILLDTWKPSNLTEFFVIKTFLGHNISLK